MCDGVREGPAELADEAGLARGAGSALAGGEGTVGTPWPRGWNVAPPRRRASLGLEAAGCPASAAGLCGGCEPAAAVVGWAVREVGCVRTISLPPSP